MLKDEIKKINFKKEPKKDWSQPELIFKTRDSCHKAGTNPIQSKPDKSMKPNPPINKLSRDEIEKKSN
jgi:hypothetical protein